MSQPLTIAVVQPPCIARDVAANALAHAAAVRSANARVVVFPELSLTGYHFDTPAVRADDARLAPIVDACLATGSVALAGAPVQDEEGRAYIALLAIDSAGATLAYRKMWLGAAEARRFTPGPTPAVITVDGWRLGLAICKDTGIPGHAVETAALEMDAYVAATLKLPDESALQDERARRVATDHHVWVAVASFAGSTGEGFDRAAGRSGIWAPDGGVVAQAGSEIGALARATLA